MVTLKPLLASIALSAIALLPFPAPAQDASQTKPELTVGEIRKIDKETSKITIKHGEIKSLDMPPMTMVFTVKDPALLDKAKAGDKVTFNVVREDGKFVVTEMQPTKP